MDNRDERMTGAQRSYLKNLFEAEWNFDEHLTKAEASTRIEELQHTLICTFLFPNSGYYFGPVYRRSIRCILV